MSRLINHLCLRNFKTFGKGLTHSADMNERRQPARFAIVDGFLPLWAFFPLKVLQVPVVRLVPFFHECGRRVGGVPRSSLKGKETQHDEGEKNTSNPKTKQLDDRVARKQVGGREQIEGKKSEVTEDE